jgi:NAD(P)-dependent dehydrogenase (short-subunit alcohol dehydrogenase family)
MSKTIFITGASRGFGKIWTEGLLKRGDKVITAVRDLSSVADLVTTYGKNIYPIKLDVNDREAVFAAVKAGKDHFGHIDTLINNAGYGLFGAVEETSEKEARDQIETNFFGLLWVTQAIIPIFREQKSGHIIQVSSALGVVALPTLGVYNASKFAVEGLTESLAPEVALFGTKVTLLEPNAYATDWGSASAVKTEANPLYDQFKSDLWGSFPADFYGNPEATTAAVLQLIDSENPPLRLFLGKVSHPFVKQAYDSRWAEWDAWKEVSDAAHGV